MNRTGEDGSRSPSKSKAQRKIIAELRSESNQIMNSSIELSTKKIYAGAMKKWEKFTVLLSIPFYPTVESLVLFITYLFRTINGVVGVLSGLARYFKLRMDWNLIRNDERITRLIQGTKKLTDKKIKKAKALPIESILLVAASLPEGRTDKDYEDLLFGVILLTGFFGVMRSGELLIPDRPNRDSYRKIIQRNSVVLDKLFYQFSLRYHKADRFYNGSTVTITEASLPSKCYLLSYFETYLRRRDARFPDKNELFLRSNGDSPNRRWFITRLNEQCGSIYSGHSLRSGGATYYASINVDRPTIQDLGRWSSDVYRSYIQSNPALLAASQIQAFSKARR